MSAVQCALMHMLFGKKNSTLRNLGLCIEYMYTLSILLHMSHGMRKYVIGVIDQVRHRTGCTAKEASFRLELILRRELVSFNMHLYTISESNRFHKECKVYIKRTETFRGSGSRVCI